MAEKKIFHLISDRRKNRKKLYFMLYNTSVPLCHICFCAQTLQKKCNMECSAQSGFIQLLFTYSWICSNLKALFSVSLVFVITILLCVCNCLVKVVPRDGWNAAFWGGGGCRWGIHGEYHFYPFTITPVFFPNKVIVDFTDEGLFLQKWKVQ